MNTLERRVQALEKHHSAGAEAFDTIIITYVKPHALHLEPQVADVYGERLTRSEGESVDDFRERAKILAHKLKPAGHVVAKFSLRPIWEASHG